MLITQSYADATRLRGMLPHVEDDCCYTEMNPTSAIQKLEQIRPDVLILSMLGNTDLELYLQCIHKQAMSIHVLVLPSLRTTIRGTHVESIQNGMAKLYFVPKATSSVLVEILNQVRTEIMHESQKPIVAREMDAPFSMGPISSEFTDGFGTLIWFRTELADQLAEMHLEKLLIKGANSFSLIWTKYTRHIWLALVRHQDSENRIIPLLKNLRLENINLILSKLITPNELDETFGKLRQLDWCYYFTAGESVLQLDTASTTPKFIPPSQYSSSLSMLLSSALRADTVQLLSNLRSLYLVLIKASLSWAVLYLTRHILNQFKELLGYNSSVQSEEPCSTLEAEHDITCATWKNIVQQRHPMPIDQYWEKTIAYISSHYSEQITVGGIAAKLGVSESALSRHFKKHVGCSIITFLLRWRIYMAALLLLEDKNSVMQIAEDVGFTDAKYFSRLFRSQVGQSPTQFRNKLLMLQKGEVSFERS